FGSASAGPGTVTATVALTGSTKTNYQLSTTSAQALATIDKRSVTASIAASGKTYDGTTAATVTSCGLETQTLDHGVVSPDDVGCSTSNANFGSASAGPGTVTPTGALTGSTKTNYQLSTTSARALATIDKRSVTASIAASGKTYDGTTAVTATVALTGSTKTNYQLSTHSAQALATIDKRSVTASIAASGKTYAATTSAISLHGALPI